MRQNKKIAKFVELLIYIVQNFNNNCTLTETKLWKLLYFCDADFFYKYRKTITGIDYCKNNYGATPIKEVIDETLPKIKGYITRERIKKADGRTITIYKPKQGKDYEYQTISANEIEEAGKICKKYFRLSVSDIVCLAHKDPPYLIAEMGGKINFNFVHYRENEEDVEATAGKRYVYKETISDEAGQKFLAYVG